MKLTDNYSRRHPYFWNHDGTREIVINFMTTSEFKFAKNIRDENGDLRKLNYLNLAMSFDIEDSSFYDADYVGEEEHKVSVMYVWQFGLDNVVIMGRTWTEFLELINLIKQYTDYYNRCLVFVHFFDHEFQFIRKWLTWTSVFSRKPRSPIYAISDGVEFRDSYILTGKSLAGVAMDLQSNPGLKKRAGDLDYSKVRGTKTHLTRKEIGYCMADVQILNTFINEKIEEEGGNIARIPLTNTGYVRRYVRKKCLPTKKADIEKKKTFYYGIHSLNMTGTEYQMNKSCFQGGFTHANALYVGEDIKGRIDSYDFTSSYPAVMLSNPYPASTGEIVKPETQEELDKYLKDFLSIFVIKFEHIRMRPEVYENIISLSKCWDVEGEVVNNGRVVSAYHLTTVITNVDLQCIKKFYTYNNFYIGRMYIYKKAYLPKPIIESILDLYQAKTELKGVAGSEVEYMLKKGMLNSIYGMMVTDIVKPEVVYKSDEWLGYELPNLEDAIGKYNKNKRRFNFYPWGVFVTSYARRNLMTGILEFKEDYIYSDTDSIKCLNAEKHKGYIERYNRYITDQIDTVLKLYGIDPERSRPKNSKGEVKQIGIWDWETEKSPYSEFKTLGAKRYMYLQGGDLHITIAGVNKKTGKDYLKTQENPFDFFSDDMVIEADKSGKLIHTYLDDEQKGELLDYQGNYMDYYEKSSVHLEKSKYLLNVSETFKMYYQGYQKERKPYYTT